MQEEVTQVSSRKKRNGQTLVEFALTLPILLMLLFGIIEFGRIFQAWVTLQNAARAAARYATTGQYDTVAYSLNTDGTEDPNSTVPCIPGVPDGLVAERGRSAVLMPNSPTNTLNHIQVYESGTEMLYASWYNGDDCNPQDDEDQNRRKDLVRILSIVEEARVGAAGLAVGAIPYLETPPPAGSTPYRGFIVANDWRQIPWFHVWDRPITNGGVQNARLAGSDQPTWFDVMICSARVKMDTESTNYIGSSNYRFRTILDDFTPSGSNPAGYPLSQIEPAMSPACFLNENPSAGLRAAGWTDNAHRPWLDAGGPGDVITIVITFNHPLVTPLGLSNYLPLQARRSAVNEAFRSSRAANLGQALPVNETDVNPTDPVTTPTDTPVDPTETPTPAPTTIPDPTATATPVPAFTCTGFTVTFLDFTGQNANFAIFNPNIQATTLKRSTIEWRILPGRDGMGIVSAYLNSSSLWASFDASPSLDIGDGGASDGAFFPNANTEIRGNSAATGSTVYRLLFGNSPTPLISWYRADFFNGSRFYIDHPDQVADCVIVFTTTVPTNTPVVANPTATPLPDCAPNLITVRWGGFDSYGVIWWSVTNRRSVPARLVGFNLNWVQRTSGASAYTVDSVWGDAFPGSGGSVEIWRSGSAAQDVAPSTRGRSGAAPGSVPAGEGTWQRDLIIDAGDETYVYFDFGGTAGPLNSSSMNATPQDYAGTQFYFGSPQCPAEGNGTGLTGTETVPVFIPQPTPPPPTPTPRPPSPPTATPRPPGPTSTPGPPAPTATPRPPSPPTATPTTPPQSPPPSGGPGGGSGND